MERSNHSTVHDVVALLRQHGVRNARSLQKLLYYCQAWSLVWDAAPMFDEDFQGWRSGPVCVEVWRHTRHGYDKAGDPSRLSTVQLATAEAVVKAYGTRSSQWLVSLTHREKPWIAARIGLGPQQQGRQVITEDSIRRYYRQYKVVRKHFDESFMASMDLFVATPEELVNVQDTRVDAEPFLNWLKTGVGDPWAKSTS